MYINEQISFPSELGDREIEVSAVARGFSSGLAEGRVSIRGTPFLRFMELVGPDFQDAADCKALPPR